MFSAVLQGSGAHRETGHGCLEAHYIRSRFFPAKLRSRFSLLLLVTAAAMHAQHDVCCARCWQQALHVGGPAVQDAARRRPVKVSKHGAVLRSRHGSNAGRLSRPGLLRGA